MDVKDIREYFEAAYDKFKSLKITDNAIELLVNSDDLEKDLELLKNMSKI